MSNNKREVVITAMGVVSPIGSTIKDFKENMFSGKSGVIDITGKIVDSAFPVKYAGWIDRDSLPKPNWHKQISTDTLLFTILSVEQILDDLPKDQAVDAIVYGTAESIGHDLVQKSFKDGLDSVNLSERSAEFVIESLAEMIEDSGKPAITKNNLIAINSACASGNQAVGLAMQRIRDGQWERAIVGGVDTRCNDANLMNFNMLGALTTADLPPEEASRPFSGDRTGFVRGEGAASLLIETRDSAEKRGAKILGVVSGYGFTSDAFRLTDGRDDVKAVTHAMKTAILDANLNLNEIDLISAHGTSTALNDKLETKAIKEIFGERAYQIPVTSLKSQIGHSTVAAGAIETVSCVLMLLEQKAAPTINYHVKDPECDLDYVPNVARNVSVNHILSNNFGFGGQNACVVISKALEK